MTTFSKEDLSTSTRGRFAGSSRTSSEKSWDGSNRPLGSKTLAPVEEAPALPQLLRRMPGGHHGSQERMHRHILLLQKKTRYQLLSGLDRLRSAVGRSHGPKNQRAVT